mgnify:CR=1 FL=1
MHKHVCNHTIHDHQCHFGWNRDNPPVIRIAPGETVEFHPVDSSGGQLNAKSTLADLNVNLVPELILDEVRLAGNMLQARLGRRPTRNYWYGHSAGAYMALAINYMQTLGESPNKEPDGSNLISGFLADDPGGGLFVPVLMKNGQDVLLRNAAEKARFIKTLVVAHQAYPLAYTDEIPGEMDLRQIPKWVSATALVVAWIGSAAYFTIARTHGLAFLARLGAPEQVVMGPVLAFGTRLVTFFLLISIFFTLYKSLPYRRVRWQQALAGALTSGVLFEVARWAFTWVVHRFNPATLYTGALAAIVIVVFWVYYGALIVIIGGEVSQVREDRIAEAGDFA